MGSPTSMEGSELSRELQQLLDTKDSTRVHRTRRIPGKRVNKTVEELLGQSIRGYVLRESSKLGKHLFLQKLLESKMGSLPGKSHHPRGEYRELRSYRSDHAPGELKGKIGKSELINPHIKRTPKPSSSRASSFPTGPDIRKMLASEAYIHGVPYTSYTEIPRVTRTGERVIPEDPTVKVTITCWKRHFSPSRKKSSKFHEMSHLKGSNSLASFFSNPLQGYRKCCIK